MFHSEFCMVEYIPANKIVLLTWKKFCCGEDYRNPVRFALELLKKNKNSNFVIDARNGFEDDKEDVKWGFTEFLPELAKTDCKDVIFIMKERNEIENEIDLWTKEFSKYVNVSRVISYEKAVDILQIKYCKITLLVEYTIKAGQRDQFYSFLQKYEISSKSKKEKGNIKYEYYFHTEDENKLFLLEAWCNQKMQMQHLTSFHYQEFKRLKEEFVEDVKIESFYSC